jgi:fused signal recognition particle receptor
MFDFLKKKIDGFVDKLTKKEEEKEPSPEKKPPEKKPTPKVKKPEPKKTKKPKEKPAKKIEQEKPEPVKEKPEIKKPELVEEVSWVKEPIPEPEKIEEEPVAEEIPEPVQEEAPVEEVLPEQVEEEAEVIEEPVPEAVKEPEPVIEETPEIVEEEPQAEPEPAVEEIAEEEAPPEPDEEIPEAEEPLAKPEPAEEEVKPPEVKEKPKERIKLGAMGAIKSFITRQVEISDDDVSGLLEEFELELLEADVDMSVAESIKDELRKKLIGSKVKKDELHSYINQTMKETLVDMLYNENAFDIVEKVKESEKPVKIMFLGINGAGKTTTIAKVAKLLMDNNQKVVFAAADTFRAAAIEQMQVHADRLNIKVIKRDYGSDPTSVAYDAMNYAKAHGIDTVLIDTAGRQDTNISLINEMKKMTRVIQPELKVYIGESIAGNAIIEQVSSFNKEIGLDAVILTKLDCDPKGGTMLSINKVTGIPIIYVGMGQAYEDLEMFDAESIVARIVE